jgi:hypothetical protein
MSDALAKPLPRAILRVSDDPLRTAFLVSGAINRQCHLRSCRLDGALQPGENGTNAAAQVHLEKFSKAWYERRKIHIFRDQTDLSLTPHVWPTIEEALLDSEYFLLLASPAASHSQWVAREN